MACDRHVPVSSGMTMQGLGQLIKLYGGAAASTEEEYQRLRQEYSDARADSNVGGGVLESIKSGMMAAQDRLHKILIGAKAAIDQAGSHLVSQFSGAQESGGSMESFKNRLQQNKQAYNDTSIFLKSDNSGSDTSIFLKSDKSDYSGRRSYDDSDDDDEKNSYDS
jgi:hypothetical protein